MIIYLIRHGEYVPASIDPLESLSSLGRDQIESTARYIKDSFLPPCEIWHSPRQRALESAEILHSILHAPNGLKEKKLLTPNSDPRQCLNLIEEKKESPIMIVSHLPFIPAMLALLTESDVCGHMKFPTGSLAVLEKKNQEERCWDLLDVMTPDSI